MNAVVREGAQTPKASAEQVKQVRAAKHKQQAKWREELEARKELARKWREEEEENKKRKQEQAKQAELERKAAERRKIQQRVEQNRDAVAEYRRQREEDRAREASDATARPVRALSLDERRRIAQRNDDLFKKLRAMQRAKEFQPGDRLPPRPAVDLGPIQSKLHHQTAAFRSKTEKEEEGTPVFRGRMHGNFANQMGIERMTRAVPSWRQV